MDPGALASARVSFLWSRSRRYVLFERCWVPLLVSYRGHPVRSRKRLSDGRLKIVLVNPLAGQPGDVLNVTQENWKLFGREEYRSEKPDVRALAAACS